MQHPLQYPLTLNFKIAALAPQISVTDASGREILYVRQKLMKLRDKIHVFADSSQAQELYEINADRILDWSARFAFTDPQGRTVGSRPAAGRPARSGRPPTTSRTPPGTASTPSSRSSPGSR